MEKEKNTGVVFLVILLFLAVISLAVYMFVGSIKPESGQIGETGAESPNGAKKVLYEDSSRDLVYAFTRECIEQDEVAIKLVELPYVNIASTYAKEINSNLKAMDLSYNSDYKYYTYLNDNILSLVIEQKINVNLSRFYTVYNIDIYTGERVSNKEIFECIGTTENKVKEVLQQSYHNAFLLKFPTISELYEDYTQSMEYKSTVSEENLSLDVPMFLGLNKSLKLVGKIYSPAGAIYYYSIVDVSL